jgi:recombinational DNA repair protein RecR
MTTYPAPLARLIQELSKLPGIGEKTSLISRTVSVSCAKRWGYAATASALAR